MTELNRFIAAIKDKGLIRTSHFEVVLGVPSVLFNDPQFTNKNLQDILMFCESCPLPGVNISSSPARTYGEIREMPYERMYGDVNLSFYVDNSMIVKRMFDKWANESIQDVKTRDFNYYVDYTADLDIHVYDVGANMRYTVTLHECWPKMVGQIELSNVSRDFMKLPVSLNYKYWTSTRADAIPVDGATVNGIFKRFVDVPDRYFTDFNAFQSGVNSFENIRTALFAQESNTTGIGSLFT